MTYERFLEKLKEARKNKHYSLQTLSGKTDISVSHLSYVERNAAMLSVEKLLKICEALEIEPHTLFEESPQFFGECMITARQLKALSERDFRIVKDLILLLSLSNEDL